MGVVYEATHRLMQQQYAVKVLSADQLSEPQTWIRFQREAQALARLNHKNIVKIFNLGIDRERYPYYVMELLEGESLQEKLKREGGLPVAQTLDIFLAVAEALAVAHRAKIVHRDIKPGNIMLCSNLSDKGECVKLVDFGLARLGQSAGFAGDPERSRLLQNLTEIGEVFGSPLYMSPEQATGSATVDERSDIYSFGCSLFEALTGQVPFHGRTVMETFGLHQNQKAPSLQETNREGVYPLELELAVARMLEKAPDKRYQNMESLLIDLRRVQEGKPVGKAVRAIVLEGDTTDGAENEFSIQQLFSSKIVRMVTVFSVIVISACLLVIYRLTPTVKPKVEDHTKAMTMPDRMKPTEGGDVKAEEEELVKKTAWIRRTVIKPGLLRFTFPEAFEPVKIAGLSGRERDKHCSGVITVATPCYVQIPFNATPPEFLKAFAATDIDEITLSEANSPKQWQKLFKIVSRWKLVKRLDIRESIIGSPKEIAPLDHFNHLDSLEFKRCRLDIDYIKDLKILKRTDNFIFDVYKPDQDKKEEIALDELFDALSGSKNLKSAHFSIQGADKDGDLLHLKNLPALAVLTIKGTTWSADKIESICAFPALQKIVLHSGDLDYSLLSRFQKSKSLQEIVVEFSLKPTGKYGSQVLNNASGRVIKVSEEEKEADWEEEEKQWQREHPESLNVSF